MAIDPAGNVWVVGSSDNGASGSDFALWKYDSEGNLAAGYPKTWGGGGWAGANALALDGAGNVWAVGYRANVPYEYYLYGYDFALWKYDSGGNLAMGYPKIWSSSGPVMDVGRGLAIDGSGNIWAVGSSDNQFALWRFDGAGNLVTGFPKLSGPRASWDIWDGNAGFGIALDGGGNVWAVGSYDILSARYDSKGFSLWKYDNDGNLAADFPRVAQGTGWLWESGNDVKVDPAGNVWAVSSLLWKHDSMGNRLPGFPKSGAGGNRLAFDGAGNVWTVGTGYVVGSGVWGQVSVSMASSSGGVARGYPKYWDAGAPGSDAGLGIAVDGNGYVWVVGYSANGAKSDDLALWKYRPDPEVGPDEFLNPGAAELPVTILVPGVGVVTLMVPRNGIRIVVEPRTGIPTGVASSEADQTVVTAVANVQGGSFSFRVFNLAGELVEEQMQNMGPFSSFRWVPRQLGTGVYVIQVEGPDVNAHKKVAVGR